VNPSGLGTPNPPLNCPENLNHGASTLRAPKWMGRGVSFPRVFLVQNLRLETIVASLTLELLQKHYGLLKKVEALQLVTRS
jgi:hypothetical protein